MTSQFNRRTFVSASVAGAVLAAASVRAQTPQGGATQQGGQAGGAPAASSLPQPGQRQGEYLEHNGAKLFYQRSGQGSPLLLVHGYPLSGALFDRVRGRLSQDHEVITVDLRGYGQSHAPGVTDSVNTYADDTLAVLDKLGVQKAIIGGMSMGGPTVLSMFKKAPERFAGMILIDTTAKNAAPPEAGEWQGFATLVQEKGVEAMVPFLLPVMLTGQTRMDDKAQVEYLTAIVKQCSKDAAISGAKALAARPDVSDLLPKIDVPTLVLVGLADGLCPFEIAQMMQQKIKGAQLHVVPGAAHAAIFEKPDDAGAAIASWAGGVRSNGGR